MSSLKDVANKAGVSMMTVSRAINQPEKVNKKTYKKVVKAINDLNYIPHFSAKKMRNERTNSHNLIKTIGVLSLNTATTPFDVLILSAIENEAIKNNLHIFIVNISENKVEHGINTLLSYKPDGIIYTTMGLRSVSIHPKLLSYTQNIVLANCYDDNHPLITSYIPDDYTGQYKAIIDVIKKGYKNFLYINLPEDIIASKIRSKATHDACADHKTLKITEYFLTNYNHGQDYDQNDDEKVYREAVTIISNHISNNSFNFDIVICGNDRIAFIVYQILLSKGLKIPSDIAVLGYDNMIAIGNLFYPPLSTIELPLFEIGKQALLSIINNKHNKGIIKIECPFIKRKSL